MKIKIIFTSVLLIVSSTSSANSSYVADKTCPAALTLSSFQEAMRASLNHQDLVVTRMMSEGKVLRIYPGTKGEFLERTTVMNGQMPVVRFAYSNNPNGFYGVWTLENCFSRKKANYRSSITTEREKEYRKLVLNTQRHLNTAGYDAGPEDGLLGAKTIKAIKQFQKTQGLKIDGKVTRLLVGELFEYNRDNFKN